MPNATNVTLTADWSLKITIHSCVVKIVDVVDTLVKFWANIYKEKNLGLWIYWFRCMEQFRWTNFIVTFAAFAIAIKPNLAAAVERTFSIVALSIDVKFVGFGGTLVYIWRKKFFPLIVKLEKK